MCWLQTAIFFVNAVKVYLQAYYLETADSDVLKTRKNGTSMKMSACISEKYTFC